GHTRDSVDFSAQSSLPPGSIYTIYCEQGETYDYIINNKIDEGVSVNFIRDSSYSYQTGVGGSWSVTSTSKIIDFTVPSSVTGIANPIASAGISVYPNPAKDVVTVNLNGIACSSAQLADITGKEVLASANGTIAMNGQTATMNVSGLSKGVYLLQLNGGSTPVVQKLVVE